MTTSQGFTTVICTFPVTYAIHPYDIHVHHMVHNRKMCITVVSGHLHIIQSSSINIYRSHENGAGFVLQHSHIYTNHPGVVFTPPMLLLFIAKIQSAIIVKTRKYQILYIIKWNLLKIHCFYICNCLCLFYVTMTLHMRELLYNVLNIYIFIINYYKYLNNQLTIMTYIQ